MGKEVGNIHMYVWTIKIKYLLLDWLGQMSGWFQMFDLANVGSRRVRSIDGKKIFKSKVSKSKWQSGWKAQLQPMLVVFGQRVKARTLGRQNERNFCYDRLAHTSIFGLCFMWVCLIKSNCYSLIYSSLVKGLFRNKVSINTLNTGAV